MRQAEALAARLGLPIRDGRLLEQALTHSSWLYEHPDEARGHNERLELLGDAVVNLAITTALHDRHPDEDEGALSARRAAIVSGLGLARLAERIDLGSHLLLGEGVISSGGRLRPRLLASGFESLAGAIYVDLGWDAARDWIVRLAAPEIELDQAPGSLKSPKSRLQELTQHSGRARATYEIADVSGPEHERQFVVRVLIDGATFGQGEGSSRRAAETAAARQAIDALSRRGDPRAVE